MQTSDGSIVVDVNEVLGRKSGDELISVLGQMRGVSGAWLSRATRRLVLWTTTRNRSTRSAYSASWCTTAQDGPETG